MALFNRMLFSLFVSSPHLKNVFNTKMTPASKETPDLDYPHLARLLMSLIGQ